MVPLRPWTPTGTRRLVSYTTQLSFFNRELLDTVDMGSRYGLIFPVLDHEAGFHK
jgi:hypothetical protein